MLFENLKSYVAKVFEFVTSRKSIRELILSTFHWFWFLNLFNLLQILSKDCRHSGAEGWWVGQEPKTGYVGVFPSGYVLNADDIANSESSGANEMKANSFEPNKWNDVTFGIGNNTDKTITVKTKEEISLDKKLPDSDVILRHSHVRTIPATELVQQQVRFIAK